MKKIFFLLFSLTASINYGMNISPRAAAKQKKTLPEEADFHVGSIPSEKTASPVSSIAKWSYSSKVFALIAGTDRAQKSATTGSFSRFRQPSVKDLVSQQIEENPELAGFESEVFSRLTPERKNKKNKYADLLIDIQEKNAGFNCASYAVAIKSESSSSDNEMQDPMHD